VGWLGPLKRGENTPKSALPRAFSSQTYAKSADPNLTNNPRPHHLRFEKAEIPVRDEPGMGLSEVRPVLVDSDLPEINLTESPVRVCYNLSS